MHIDKYLKKVDDESFPYIDNDGVSHQSKEDYIQTEILGFCGCGDPEVTLIYIRNILKLICNVSDSSWSKKAVNELNKYFHSNGEKYTMYYLLDKLELTEHGGSVPGWLTTKGKELLEDLNEIYNL